MDEVFETHRQRQYPRELLFSTVVDLMSLVSLSLSPSLHAAAKKAPHLPVSVTALYDKIKRTEPAILRALVQGAAQRLQPVVETLLPHGATCRGGGCPAFAATGATGQSYAGRDAQA